MIKNYIKVFLLSIGILVVAALVNVDSFYTLANIGEWKSELKSKQGELGFIQTQIKESEKLIQELNERMSVEEQEAQEIDGLLELAEEEVQNLEEQIAILNKEIEEILYEKDVLKEKLDQAKLDFEEKTKHLTGGDKDFLGYVATAKNSSDMKHRLSQLEIVNKVYQDAIAKYEKEFQTKEEQEGISKLKKSELERNQKVLQTKRDFILEQKRKKEEIIFGIRSELTEAGEFHDNLGDISNQITGMIADLQSQIADEERRIAEEERRAAEERARQAQEYARQQEYNSPSEKGSTGTISRADLNGPLLFPSANTTRITSYYGYRTHPITKQKNVLHAGIDIGAAENSAVLAAESGRVITASKISGYGNTVIIDHGDGLSTLYAHNNRLNVKVGEKVTRGQKIAEVGSTGNSTGPHIHFEVRVNGKFTDPMPYLK